MNTFFLFFLSCVLFLNASCTNAELAKFTALGRPGHLTCYSGGKVIYEGTSTGVIHSESKSDGWFLQDSKTKHLIRASGDCIIEAL